MLVVVVVVLVVVAMVVVVVVMMMMMRLYVAVPFFLRVTLRRQVLWVSHDDATNYCNWITSQLADGWT